jgi:hypothetical protein
MVFFLTAGTGNAQAPSKNIAPVRMLVVNHVDHPTDN